MRKAGLGNKRTGSCCIAFQIFLLHHRHFSITIIIMRRHDFSDPFPPLVFERTRVREYAYYSERERADVVYAFLVDGMTTREMDVKILSQDYASKGYQSFGIYRYLGLNGSHQGFFSGWKNHEIITYMHRFCADPRFCLIFHYLLISMENDKSESHAIEAEPLVLDLKSNYPEGSIIGQDWIVNTYLCGKKNIDYSLLCLSDTVNGKGKISVKERDVWYSSNEVKESVKSLYDFRCQVCGDIILRTGWRSDYSRCQQWRFMSADIHHILPLSQGGPDIRSNMICLCPSCHRKFHSGEFRLKEKADRIICVDELLGRKKDVRKIHEIHLL